jgi:membrane protein DedA with SNARE-associated domain
MEAFIMSVLDYIASLGIFGIALGLMIEVIPSELVLGYGGYLVSIREINFFEAVVAGTIGGTLAQLFLYWMGYFGGRPFLEKYGKYLLIKTNHLDVAEEWFNKFGTGVIFTARFIPVVRHAISIPAGIARMSFAKFTIYTVLAIIPWTILFLYLGMVLGTNWMEIKAQAEPYILPIIIVAVLSMSAYVLHKRKTKTV